MTNFGPIGGLVAAVQILLADDNERMLKAVERLSQGFELADDIVFVGEVADGQALVERALLLKPDIIITDINMPILDGIRAAARLKEAGCP